jgi:threonine/homoserine/homoserine lactone efflux protein
MFGTQHFLMFLIAAIALNLVPGQDTLYIIGRSLSQGRKAGIISVLGIGSGCLIHITAAAIGLYSVLALWPPAFSLIADLGALYLIWLGIMTWVNRKSLDIIGKTGSTSDSDWLIFRQGLMTNLLNPKVALFFIAFLPQFIDPVSNLGAISFLFLGVTFFCTGSIWCTFVAFFSSSVADTLRERPHVQTGFDLFTAVLFVALGVGLFLSHR